MKIKNILIFGLLACLILACARQTGPAEIATYPKGEPIAVYPRSLENMVVYNAMLDLQVSNVERAVERAKEIAFNESGYLVSSQSWYRDGEKHTTVVLAVPVHRFDNTRADLLRLGELTGEWISSEFVSDSVHPPDSYSQITLYLHPKDTVFPELSLPKWRPVRTFEKAWSVFISIFGFLLDIIIWLTVVIGPFLLIGWVSMRLFQWWQRR